MLKLRIFEHLCMKFEFSVSTSAFKYLFIYFFFFSQQNCQRQSLRRKKQNPQHVSQSLSCSSCFPLVCSFTKTCRHTVTGKSGNWEIGKSLIIAFAEVRFSVNRIHLRSGRL